MCGQMTGKYSLKCQQLSLGAKIVGDFHSQLYTCFQVFYYEFALVLQLENSYQHNIC